MEMNRQKLDILIIEDKLNLSMDELIKRANHAANEDAITFGWESIEVKPSATNPEKNGEYMRYSFDVFGVPRESINAPSEQQSVLDSASKPKTAAAKNLEI